MRVFRLAEDMEPSSRSHGKEGGSKLVLAGRGPGEATTTGLWEFWKVKFVSDGNPGIPDGVVLDNAFVQWHSDGTEIMNSSRPPRPAASAWGYGRRADRSATSSITLPLSSDLSGNLIGPAQIREEITLNQRANQYEGTFRSINMMSRETSWSTSAGRVTRNARYPWIRLWEWCFERGREPT